MFCNKCGAKIIEEQKYCVRCGNVIQNNIIDTPNSIMALEEFENLRKNVVKKEIIIYVTMFIMIVILEIVIYNIMNDSITTQHFFMAIIIPLIIGSFFLNSGRRKIKNAYKNIVVLESLKNTFSDVYYEPNNGINEQILRNTAMIRMGDKYYSNDYISAKYKNIPFIASDILIEDERSDSDGHTYAVTLFKGQWFIFDFNKSFKADLQICEKGFMNNRRRLFSEDRLKKVELEDINFNKEFNVYAQNELDAFYVLTPNTMEKIKEVENKVTGKLLFCFIDNKLHVGLYNNKDLFEYKNIYKSINLEKEKSNVLQDMKNITEFVDILDLDNDLFRREN